MYIMTIGQNTFWRYIIMKKSYSKDEAKKVMATYVRTVMSPSDGNGLRNFKTFRIWARSSFKAWLKLCEAMKNSDVSDEEWRAWQNEFCND